jgi:hypothetical protein
VNKLYRDLTLVRVEAAVAGARAAAGINHPVLKGQLCEIVMRDLLRPLLPADIAVGTGVVVTADDIQSRQQDVLLIDKSIVPPIVFEGATGIFPVESVLFAIEVKKTLNARELASSIESANELSLFTCLPGLVDADDKPTTTELLNPISAILAFESDLTKSGKTELERFKESWDHPTADPPIKVICVVDRGCWYWKRPRWELWPRTYRYHEVISFIASIMNTYRLVRESRGEPRLGNYLLE